MTIPNQSIQKELQELKKCVKNSKNNFRDNYKRFNDFRKFVYKTSISQGERDVNDEIGRPNIETNILPAFQARLCGEFAKQEPSFQVSKAEGAQISSEVPMVVEGHLRHIMEEAKESNTQYATYRDSLSGGYGVLTVFTDYANEMSFDQVLKVRKANYPTLCGYDPLARLPHKCDGNYQFEIYPKTKQDLIDEHGDAVKKYLDQMKFHPSSSIEGFAWSFNDGDQDIALCCKFYKKKKKRVKLLDVAGQKPMTKDQYEEFLKKWQSEGRIEPPPVAGRERWTTLTTICRYIFTETIVFEYEETDFKYLPQPFVDGDSIDLYDDDRGSVEQFTRPYCFNAEGAQRLKNLGVQCLAGYLEMMTQHKYIIKKEAIPQEKSYIDALTRVQKASTIVVNAFKDNNPNHAIPDPIIPVMPQPAPPEISNSIMMADKIIQSELGSYDAALGINDNELSGIAIIEAATQSNSAAMPFVVNYIQAINQVALILVDLMPKYYKTPMTIPVIDKEGKRSAVKINQAGGVDFNYDSNMLQVKVTAGVNWAIQKSRALNQLIGLSKAVPGFGDFIQRKGLKVVIDNLEIRGSDILKELVDQYEDEQKKAAAQQQAMQQHMTENNPNMMNAHSKAFSAQADAKLKSDQIELEKEELEIKREVALADRDAALARANAEEVRAAADIKMQHIEMNHRHVHETLQLAHKIEQSEKG